MNARRNLTRQRLIKSAFRLFVAQGVTATTTRQIAELAGVNEVTLFRQFTNKQGLLQAVLEDTTLLTQLGEILGQQAHASQNVAQALRGYASLQLQALAQAPELVRSLIGESGQYSVETAQALGQGLTQINHYTAQYLETVLRQESLQSRLSIEQLASLLNGLLVGYVVLEVTSPSHGLWQNQTEFLANLVELFLQAAIPQQTSKQPLSTEPSTVPISPVQVSETVIDLPAPLVHLILKRTKKLGQQDYALAYVLFAAGLSAEEAAMLLRSHSLSSTQAHLLQVNRSTVQQVPVNQVPVNQWILGQRYGSYLRNPLTQWLKSRKDDQTAMFLNEAGHAISSVEIRLRWQIWIDEVAPGRAIAIEQAQQTWRVEMLVKGMKLENLSLLTGLTMAQLQPYAERAREKATIDQAIQLDQKFSSGDN